MPVKPAQLPPMFKAKDHNPPLAILLMVMATTFIAASTAFAKALGTGVVGDGVVGDGMHALQITFGRFLIAFALFSIMLVVFRPRFTRIHWKLHVQRTSCGWGGVTLMFAAVAAIPLADATAISFLNPVFAMILAIPLLGERVGPVRWGAAALALCGAIILLRPGTGTFQPAALLALGAAMVLGLEVIFMKRLAVREGAMQVLWVNNLIGLGIASVATLAVWSSPSPEQWMVMAGVGISMAMAQVCFINAVARADASFVVPFSYATLISAALLDFLVFGVSPLPVSMLGAGVIIAGGALLAWREGRVTGRATSPQPHAD